MKERRISLLPSWITSKKQKKNNKAHNEAKHKRKHRTSESIANAVESKVVFFIFIFFSSSYDSLLTCDYYSYSCNIRRLNSIRS